tara:strand:+ start:646 stop:1725 length:1080 start_codon:yes stop_codon:yes gene_type:complete
MNKLKIYLFSLTSKYILFNLIIISVLVMFINLIELSRLIEKNDYSLYKFFLLTFLKLPSILNDIIPFVTIIGVSFLFRNLINNNELISMRNIGLSIFDIFAPIGMAVFLFGLFFLLILNPISSNFENKFKNILNKKDQDLYSIKINNNEMWIKNNIDENSTRFINIKNIDLKEMMASDIEILLINPKSKIFIKAEDGKFNDNYLFLENVTYYDLKIDSFEIKKKFEIEINFNKENIINSIANYKLIPFYKYFSHTKTLKKFNLYSSEIGLFYISEFLKPIFIVMLSFVVVGVCGKFKRNENFFKILFISIFIGFLVFFLKELITKFTITLNINFLLSYSMIFFIPFSIGLYQIINIEND